MSEKVWNLTKDGDPECRELYNRHYSRYKYADGRQPKLFVGPGYKIVLRTETCDAMFVWRKYIDDCPLAPENGVMCSVFRNESPRKSSDMILEAETWAWERWPDATLYTYVASDKVASTNPGFCFLKAGWVRMIEKTKKADLHVLTKSTPFF